MAIINSTAYLYIRRLINLKIMFKPKFLIAAIAGLLFFSKANAQTDTSYYDLGRTLLKKDFTQSITVKGTDLEKMSFDNLAEAINVWFYGSYTTVPNLVYIIDGNLANDVNAYSIYDIDEVTLIQNSLTQLNGTTGQQQLILIKTKRNKGKGTGVVANGQINTNSLYTNNTFNSQTNNYETALKSTSALFQQYYVSAYTNTNNVHAGVSVDFLRDVLPVLSQTGISYTTPEYLNRLRFNGYFNAKIGNSDLDITMGYAPQKVGEGTIISQTTEPDQDESLKQTEHLFNTAIKLITPIFHGLTNTIHADYNNYNLVYGDQFQSSGVDASYYTENSKSYSNDFVAYDNLSYNLKFGSWSLEPSVNLNYRTFRDTTYNYGGGDEYYYNSSSFKEHFFLLTSSIDLYYKSFFNIDAGLLSNLNTGNNLNPYNYSLPKQSKQFPFVTASADILQLIDPKSDVSVKIYGSYSVSDVVADTYSDLFDFNSTNVQAPVLYHYPDGTESLPYDESLFYYPSNYVYDTEDTKQNFKSFSAGINITPLKSGLVFSYFFNRSNNLSLVYVEVPQPPNFEETRIYYSADNLMINRVSVDYKLNNSFFSWQTGINATNLLQKFPVYNSSEASLGGGQWTGGWVNRLSYRSFFAGADLLYQIGEKVYTVAPPNYNSLSLTKINSFSLQNLYLGYRIKTAKLKTLDVFVNARNIFQNQKEDITNSRKYYGLGVNLSL